MSLPSPKGRRCSPSPGSIKTGPLKATLPVASLVKAESVNKCKSNSPITALQSRYSPHEPTNSGHRSPGSSSFKGYRQASRGQSRSKVCSPISCSIRRTASMDAIYLKGKWPTEPVFMHIGLQIDKGTQTEEWWGERRACKQVEGGEDVKVDKYVRVKGGRIAGMGLRLISPPIMAHMAPAPTPPNQVVAGPWTMCSPSRGTLGPLKPPVRGSLEGLNQEIERLVLKDLDDKTIVCGSIPEGHRAPLLELLRPTRSVNTQTPGSNGDEPDTDFGSSGPPSRGSMSPHYYMDLMAHPSRNESCGSSPDDGCSRAGTSPHINRFLAREPPDGCERVSLKVEEWKKGAVPVPVAAAAAAAAAAAPLVPTAMFKPSLSSAFHPLHTHQDSLLLNPECSKAEKGERA